MPFYEYECQSCQHVIEVLQKISDPVLTACPECGRESLRKLISVPVFRLKGKGWYETDFKSDGESQRNLAGPEKEEVKKEVPPAEAKPESKEAKPAPAAAPAASATPAPAPAAPKRKKAAAGGAAQTSTLRPAAKAARAAKGKAKGKAVAKSTQ